MRMMTCMHLWIEKQETHISISCNLKTDACSFNLGYLAKGINEEGKYEKGQFTVNYLKTYITSFQMSLTYQVLLNNYADMIDGCACMWHQQHQVPQEVRQ